MRRFYSSTRLWTIRFHFTAIATCSSFAPGVLKPPPPFSLQVQASRNKLPTITHQISKKKSPGLVERRLIRNRSASDVSASSSGTEPVLRSTVMAATQGVSRRKSDEFVGDLGALGLGQGVGPERSQHPPIGAAQVRSGNRLLLEAARNGTPQQQQLQEQEQHHEDTFDREMGDIEREVAAAAASADAEAEADAARATHRVSHSRTRAKAKRKSAARRKKPLVKDVFAAERDHRNHTGAAVNSDPDASSQVLSVRTAGRVPVKASELNRDRHILPNNIPRGVVVGVPTQESGTRHGVDRTDEHGRATSPVHDLRNTEFDEGDSAGLSDDSRKNSETSNSGRLPAVSRNGMARNPTSGVQQSRRRIKLDLGIRSNRLAKRAVNNGDIEVGVDDHAYGVHKAPTSRVAAAAAASARAAKDANSRRNRPA